MKVILFCSKLNPLSAIAAKFFYDQGLLDTIAFPEGYPKISQGGLWFQISMYLIGLYRYIHIFCRRVGFKNGIEYLSTIEFLQGLNDIDVETLGRDELGAFIKQKIRENKTFCFVSCIFPFRIPVITSSSANNKMINIHPGLLPENRGPNPYFWALANNLKNGLTIHVITNKYDEGAILYRQKIVVETSTKLSEYRIEEMIAKKLSLILPNIFNSFDDYYLNSQPQKRGIYFKEPLKKNRRQFNMLGYFNGYDLIRIILNFKKSLR